MTIFANANKKRCFVVGCPRSGTTLLQAILASHDAFMSFPETQFFVHNVNDIDFRRYGRYAGRRHLLLSPIYRVMNYLGYASPHARRGVLKFLERINRPDLISLFPDNMLSIRANTVSFIRLLDSLSGNKDWIEKSPNHLFCIDVIYTHVPDPLFVHIIRKGEDVIASIYNAAQKYELWRQRYWAYENLDQLIALWNRGVSISLACKRQPNHHVIMFEDLIRSPFDTLQSVTTFLGVGFQKSMINYRVEGLVMADERWKSHTNGNILPPQSKFDQVFSTTQQQYIRKRLKRLPFE